MVLEAPSCLAVEPARSSTGACLEERPPGKVTVARERAAFCSWPVVGRCLGL